jgi:arylsulfatase A-like enzyme
VKSQDVVRFIPEEPQRDLDSDPPYRMETVWEVDLQEDVSIDMSLRNPPLLNHQEAFPAAEVDVLELTLKGLSQGQVKLRWKRAGESLSAERELKLQAEHLDGDEVKRFPFSMVSHPEWEGSVVELKAHTGRDERRSVKPLMLRALRRSLEHENQESWLRIPWWANLGRDLRPSLLAPPGHVIRRTVVVPEDGFLLLGMGVQAGSREAVDFQVHLVSPVRKLLFERKVDPRRESGRGWKEGRVDLSRWAGKQVVLELRTGAGGDFDLTRGFPLWSNPVLARESDEAGPNLVLVSVDTLRADHLSAYGYPAETSPHLDRWARESAVTFRNVVAQAPSTLPSHASLFTGLGPFRHGAVFRPLPASLDTLAEILRERGYTTLARTGGGYLHPRYGLHQGFDSYQYWLSLHERDKELEEGMNTALGWLEAYRKRPFFLFLHTYEVHGPYRVRQPFFSRLNGERKAPDGLVWLVANPPLPESGFRATRPDYYRVRGQNPSDKAGERVGPDTARALYDSSVAYVDSQLGILLDRLSDLDLMERTVVVVTSDHGESFGEHGISGHGYLYDDNLLVPLLMSLPDGQGAGQVVESQVRSLDILPTLLESLDIEIPEGLEGASLMPLIRGEDVSVDPLAWSYAGNSNHGVALRVANRVKYIFNDTAWSPVQGSEEFYELQTDPGEMDPGALDQNERELYRERVRDEIEGYLAGLRIQARNGGPGTLIGAIKGAPVTPSHVKTADQACDCVFWRDDGSIQFVLAPEQASTLVFSGSQRGTLTLTVELLDPPRSPQPIRSEMKVDLASELPTTLRLANGQWRREAGQEEDFATGIFLWWQEPYAADSETGIVPEPELLRQLQALGYVQ